MKDKIKEKHKENKHVHTHTPVYTFGQTFLSLLSWKKKEIFHSE